MSAPVDYWNANAVRHQMEVDTVVLRRQLQVLAHYSLSTDAVVADLGCGAGWAIPELFNYGAAHIYAVDESPEMLALIPEDSRITKIAESFRKSDIFKSQSLDAVLLSSAFHHTDDPWILMFNMTYWLKAGGLIYIIGEEPVRWYQRFIWIKRWLEGKGGWPFRHWMEIDRQLGDHGCSYRYYKRLFHGFHSKVFRFGRQYAFVVRT